MQISKHSTTVVVSMMLFLVLPSNGQNSNSVCSYSQTPQKLVQKPMAAHPSSFGRVAKNKPQLDRSPRGDLRRLWLDVAGVLPPLDVVDTYLAADSTTRWPNMVERLLASEEYVARWTTFFDDLFWNHALDLSGYIRNRFHNKLRASVASNQPLDEMVRDILLTRGKTSAAESSNFYYFEKAFDEGFRLDYLDDQIGFITETMLGVETNCISCHDGAYHLEEVNKGLSTMTRKQFWGMAAFLAKSYVYIHYEDVSEEGGVQTLKNLQFIDLDVEGYNANVGALLLTYNNGQEAGEYVADSAAGEGMRPRRNGGIIPPAYLTSGEPPGAGEPRRVALARMITADRQFARNMVNRIWTHFMGQGFVDSVTGWDLGRVDKTTAANYQTTVQPKTVELLEWLTDQFIDNGYDLRAFLRLILKGPVYSEYGKIEDNQWPASSFWRQQRQPRRLEAEALVESFFRIHRIPIRMVATGYTQKAFDNPWEMPGPYEPSSNAIFAYDYSKPPLDPSRFGFENENEYYAYQGFILGLLHDFDRGEYDLAIARATEPSIQNSLVLLNHPGWNYWLAEGQTSPFIEDQIRKLNNQIAATSVASDMYHAILYRDPTKRELEIAGASFAGKTQEMAVKDLAWALFNHPDFLYR